jgi:tetratricopeptide (TPR) repeat protein
MTGALWRSAFVAAAFALHPLHVESVAWAAERKDLLCGLFWMLTIAAYVRYAKKPGLGRYIPVIAAFILGLMSKPMIVTLPFVLLLLDWWPLRRLQGQIDSPYKKASIRLLLAEKLPLFILVIISSVITFIAQRQQGAMDMLAHLNLPLNVRIANALISYMTYISKMVYPSQLAVLYPHPGGDFPLWEAMVSLGIIMLITAMAFLLVRRKPYIFAGWFWYLGTLVPVIGFVQIGAQGMADRYTYLPSVGLFITIAWGIAEIAAKRRVLKIGVGISAVIIVVLLIFSTRKQVKYWKNNFTLFQRSLTVTGDNPVMLYNMGAVLQIAHHFDLALKCYHQALLYKTDHFQAEDNIGSILRQKGNFDDAATHIYRALQINPEYPRAYNNLGLVLAAQGNLNEAIIHFRRAIEIEPDFVDARQNLAATLKTSGYYDEALSQYRKILQLDSNHSTALNAIALMLITHPNPELRNADEAVRLAERAAKITKYRNPIILETLARTYGAAGRFDRAVNTIQKAINLARGVKNENLVNYLSKQLEAYKQKMLPEEPDQETE